MFCKPSTDFYHYKQKVIKVGRKTSFDLNDQGVEIVDTYAIFMCILPKRVKSKLSFKMMYANPCKYTNMSYCTYNVGSREPNWKQRRKYA